MSCDFQFPKEIPVGCISDVISLIRSGDALSDPRKLISYATPVALYGIGMFIDDPAPNVIGSAPVKEGDYTHAEIADGLQSVLDSCSDKREGLPVAALPIPWAILAPLLMKLIEEALKRLGQ